MKQQAAGRLGEDYAESYIISLGWIILARNLHFPSGEIDILADTGDMIAVVEVKAKTTDQFGHSIEMITPRKQRKLKRLAKRIEQEYNKPVRIDVIAIDALNSTQMNLEHYPYAVGE